jgi:hypothetical protein
MTSAAARASINRSNAQSSTGPRTPEGKSASSRNSLAHGMTSKSIVLAHESQEEYDAMRESLIDSYKPAGEHETAMVDRIAQAHWRLQRCYRVETAFIENRVEAAQEETPDIDPDAAMARMFVDKAESAKMRLLMRYLGAAERAFYKAMSDLEKAQAARRKREAEEVHNAAFRAIYSNPPKSRGFVSQPTPSSPPAVPVSEPRPKEAVATAVSEPRPKEAVAASLAA